MSLTFGILAMATLTYGIRLWGLLLPGARVSGFAARFLQFIPVAVFAALVVTGLPGADLRDSALRLAAALATGALVWWRGSFALGLLVGLGAYLAVRVAIGG
jgi:branched-subunit amino acid transport protein